MEPDKFRSRSSPFRDRQQLFVILQVVLSRRWIQQVGWDERSSMTVQQPGTKPTQPVDHLRWRWLAATLPIGAFDLLLRGGGRPFLLWLGMVMLLGLLAWVLLRRPPGWFQLETQKDWENPWKFHRIELLPKLDRSERWTWTIVAMAAAGLAVWGLLQPGLAKDKKSLKDALPQSSQLTIPSVPPVPP
jgi:hypothetical protein